MGDIAAIIGVVLLFVGIFMVAIMGERRSFSWIPFIGMGLAVLGLGIELVGAVVVAA
jgi:uncharacterized membrane protein